MLQNLTTHHSPLSNPRCCLRSPLARGKEKVELQSSQAGAYCLPGLTARRNMCPALRVLSHHPTTWQSHGFCENSKIRQTGPCFLREQAGPAMRPLKEGKTWMAAERNCYHDQLSSCLQFGKVILLGLFCHAHLREAAEKAQTPSCPFQQQSCPVSPLPCLV